MRIEANTISLIGIICCVFWYAIYGLARLLLSASRIWLVMDRSNAIPVKSPAQFTNSKGLLNLKTI